MKVGDMRFVHVWLGKAARPEPGDGGVIFEILGRTRPGGYYRVSLPALAGEPPRREWMMPCFLERWFLSHGYDFPDWIREEVRDGSKILAETNWQEDEEKKKVKRAQERSSEVELQKLEAEFLNLLERPW